MATTSPPAQDDESSRPVLRENVMDVDNASLRDVAMSNSNEDEDEDEDEDEFHSAFEDSIEGVDSAEFAMSLADFLDSCRDPKDGFEVLKLPRELRDQIWEECLTATVEIQLIPGWEVITRIPVGPPPLPAIAQAILNTHAPLPLTQHPAIQHPSLIQHPAMQHPPLTQHPAMQHPPLTQQAIIHPPLLSQQVVMPHPHPPQLPAPVAYHNAMIASHTHNPFGYVMPPMMMAPPVANPVPVLQNQIPLAALTGNPPPAAALALYGLGNNANTVPPSSGNVNLPALQPPTFNFAPNHLGPIAPPSSTVSTIPNVLPTTTLPPALPVSRRHRASVPKAYLTRCAETSLLLANKQIAEEYGSRRERFITLLIKDDENYRFASFGLPERAQRVRSLEVKLILFCHSLCMRCTHFSPSCCKACRELRAHLGWLRPLVGMLKDLKSVHVSLYLSFNPILPSATRPIPCEIPLGCEIHRLLRLPHLQSVELYKYDYRNHEELDGPAELIFDWHPNKPTETNMYHGPINRPDPRLADDWDP